MSVAANGHGEQLSETLVTRENKDVNEENEEFDEEFLSSPAECGEDLRGRKTSKKTVTKTVRIIKRSTSRRRVRSRRFSESEPLVVQEPGDLSPAGTIGPGTKMEKSQSMGKISSRISFLDPNIPIVQNGHEALGQPNDIPTQNGLRLSALDGSPQAQPAKNRPTAERIIDLQVDPILKGSESLRRKREEEGRYYESKSPSGTLPKSKKPSNGSSETQWPVELLVTHVAPSLGGKEKPKTYKLKLLLDSWLIAVHQTVRWSELKNFRNTEIDGISRLKIHQNAFGYEYSVMEY